MSSVVTYAVPGMKLDASVFALFKQKSADKNEIKSLEKLTEDEMTITQFKHLKRLKAGRKTIMYNTIMITTKSELEEPDASIYFNKSDDTLYIPGHEGSGLTFKLAKDKFNYELKNDYFDDNYDSHLNIVQNVIEHFQCSCIVKYISDEMDSGEDVPDTHYVRGVEQCDTTIESC